MKIKKLFRALFKKETAELPETYENEHEKVRRGDWDTYPMPLLHTKFVMKEKYTDEEMKYLSLGHLPLDMDDRWFSFMEGDTLYIFRSWSGYCIFTVKFEKGRQTVIVNRDEKQYTGNDVKEEKILVRGLIVGWIYDNKNAPERNGEL